MIEKLQIENLNKVVINFEKKLLKLKTLGSNPILLDEIYLEYYGEKTKLNQIASIKSQDSKNLIITPYDFNILKDISTAINKSDLGLNPIDEGKSIRLIIPPLTEQKRIELTKKAKFFLEESKISIRNLRQEFNKKVQKNNEISKDEQNIILKKYQENVEIYNKKIEEIFEKKTIQLMKV